MAKPHATSALGGQDEVGQLTQPFFLFISPQDCDLRTPVSRGAGKREQEPEVSTVDRGAAHVLSHRLLPQQPRPEEAVGRERGRASKCINS